MQSEIPLCSRVGAAFALAGTPSDMLEFAVFLPPCSVGPASGLYRSLVASTSAWKPEDLLHYLMQHDIVRPTFEVERKARTFTYCADLLKTAFLHDSTTEKLSLTAGLLKTLQKRLEDPQLTSFRTSANPTAPQEMLVMHCAFVDVCKNQLITYNRLRLDVTVTPNQRSGPFSKLREAKNSVELRAAWEKREFCPRTSASPSNDGVDSSNSMKDWLQSDVDKHDTGARDFADCPSDDPPPPSYESLFHGPAVPIDPIASTILDHGAAADLRSEPAETAPCSLQGDAGDALGSRFNIGAIHSTSSLVEDRSATVGDSPRAATTWASAPPDVALEEGSAASESRSLTSPSVPSKLSPTAQPPGSRARAHPTRHQTSLASTGGNPISPRPRHAPPVHRHTTDGARGKAQGGIADSFLEDGRHHRTPSPWLNHY